MNDALFLSGTKKSIPHYESGREDLNFRPPGSNKALTKNQQHSHLTDDQSPFTWNESWWWCATCKVVVGFLAEGP